MPRTTADLSAEPMTYAFEVTAVRMRHQWWHVEVTLGGVTLYALDGAYDNEREASDDAVAMLARHLGEAMSS